MTSVRIHKGICYIKVFDEQAKRTSDIECKHNGNMTRCHGCIVTTGMPSNRNVLPNLFEGKTPLPQKKEETDKEKRWKRVH